MGANPTLSRVLGGLLIVVAIARIVVALTRNGNNMLIALAGRAGSTGVLGLLHGGWQTGPRHGE